MPLVLFIISGLLAGAGLVMVFGGTFGSVVPLSVLAGNQAHSRGAASGLGIEVFAGDAATRHSQDLAVCERTTAKFASDRLINSAVFAFIPALLFLLSVAGVVAISPLLLLVVTAGCGWGGWYYTTPALKKSAREARDVFEASLSTYFELVSLGFSGGKGPTDALRDSASIGTGPAFRRLRTAMNASYERREAPWVTLLELGERLGVQSLIDLGASVTMAADGAPVVDSLRAKAETMREQSMTAQEARAEARSETMSVPVVLMFGGFLILFGYPALSGLLSLR